MQGVVKAYNPATGDGIIVRDTDLNEYELAPHALEGSIFRMLRQGQRVNFTVDAAGRASQLRIGSERDMGTPGH
jgi:CspA family cold shock protein